MTITLPWATPTGNKWQRMHWGAKQRLVIDHRMSVRSSSVLGGWRPRWGRLISTEKRPGPGLHTRLTITRYGSRTLDHDNLVTGCKPLLDALVREGVIFEDSPTWVSVEYRQRKSTRKEERTEIEIHG